MRICLYLLLCGALLYLLVAGCGRDSATGLDAPEQLTLYSIDGRDFEPGQRPKATEAFKGYPVLGKVEVTDPDKRKEITESLKKGLAKSDGKMAKCFWPRHAIRVVEKGRTIDYVICFECYQLETYKEDAKTVKPITKEPQQVLNRHLTDAGVPLAPGMKDGDK